MGKQSWTVAAAAALLAWSSHAAIAQIDFSVIEPYRGNQRCIITGCGGDSGMEEAGAVLGRGFRDTVTGILDALFTARPDPVVAQFHSKLNEADAAHARGDLDRTTRLVREALALREEPYLRKWLAHAEAYQLMDQANAAVKAGDLRGAAARIRQAMMKHESYNTKRNEQYAEDLELRAKLIRDIDLSREQELRNRPEAIRLNDEGVALMKAGKPYDALSKFERALGLIGYEREINANFWIAKAMIAYRGGDLTGTLAGLENARSHHPDNSAAATLLAQAQAHRNAHASTIQATWADSRQRLSTPHTDTTVVDARVAKWGADLMKALAIENADAAERMRKGLMAAKNQDWPVALAYWQDAKNRDPANPAIANAVELAEWTLQYRQRTGVPASTPLDPAFEAWARGEKRQAVKLLEDAVSRNPPLRDAVAQIKEDMDRSLADTSARSPATAPGRAGETHAELVATVFERMADRMTAEVYRQMMTNLDNPGRPVLNDRTQATADLASELRRGAAALRGNAAPAQLEFVR